LMSAPAAKKPSRAEDTTMTFTFPAASALSMAACRPSSTGTLSALAGGDAIVTCLMPGVSMRQVTRSGHREATTHRQGLAGDETRGVGGEERDGRADVVGGSQSF